MLVLPSAWTIALQKPCRQNTKSQPESKTEPFTYSQANLQEVSTHKCRKKMYARSKCQKNFFFKQTEETVFQNLWSISGMFLSICYMLYSNTVPSITGSHPFDPSNQQLTAEVQNYPFFFTLSTRFKKKKSVAIGNCIQGLRKQREQLSKYLMLYWGVC